MKKIGILGGMGPEATAELFRRMIEILQGMGISRDGDFPDIFIRSLPVPDVIEKEGTDISAMLMEGLESLQKMGAEVLAIPCNTATCIVERTARVPGFVSIVKETAKKAKETGCRTVGILSTRKTLKTRVYQEGLKSEGLGFVLPTEQESEEITGIILRILAGRKFPEDKAMLERIAARMISEGADAVILGCTELPLLFRSSSIRTIDTIQVLAEALVREACSDIMVRGGVMASIGACGASGAGSNPARGPTFGGALK